MKDILTVAKFTMKEMVRRKSFIVSTIIILVMIIVGMNIPGIIKSINGDDRNNKLMIVDNANVFEGNLEFVKTIDSNYDIEISNNTYEEVKDKIEKEELDSAIIVDVVNNNVKMRYVVKDTTMMQEVPEDVVNSINVLYTNMQISKLGLTEEQLKSITPNFEFSLEQTSEKKAEGNVLVIMLLSMVLFFAIYFCAFQVSSSITTEKTSKIMETLVTSTTPRTIVLGKTIGIGLVGLFQLAVIIATALCSAKAFLDPQLLNTALDMSNITVSLGILTFVYFILGYAEYALLYALTGSTVSKPEDIQSANSPIVLISIVGFYLSYFTMMNPTGSLNELAAILPISSPFCMPFRIMMGLADVKEIAISITVLAITIFIIAKVSIKIYSSAVLNYGSKMSMKDLIKVYKDKSNR